MTFLVIYLCFGLILHLIDYTDVTFKNMEDKLSDYVLRAVIASVFWLPIMLLILALIPITYWEWEKAGKRVSFSQFYNKKWGES